MEGGLKCVIHMNVMPTFASATLVTKFWYSTAPICHATVNRLGELGDEVPHSVTYLLVLCHRTFRDKYVYA